MKPQIKCQNGCKDGVVTLNIINRNTGEVRALCWRCVTKLSTPPGGKSIFWTLKDGFENWPGEGIVRTTR
jgi:hypothetical protein